VVGFCFLSQRKKNVKWESFKDHYFKRKRSKTVETDTGLVKIRKVPFNLRTKKCQFPSRLLVVENDKLRQGIKDRCKEAHRPQMSLNHIFSRYVLFDGLFLDPDLWWLFNLDVKRC
jgi:hypothetical protein